MYVYDRLYAVIIICHVILATDSMLRVGKKQVRTLRRLFIA